MLQGRLSQLVTFIVGVAAGAAAAVLVLSPPRMEMSLEDWVEPDAVNPCGYTELQVGEESAFSVPLSLAKSSSALANPRIEGMPIEDPADTQGHGCAPYDAQPCIRVSMEARDSEGRPHGVYRKWWPGSEQLFEEGHYEHGLEAGEWRRWCESGVLLSLQTYQDGRSHGTHKAWRSDGTLLVACTYEHGLLSGVYRTYHDNGCIDLEGSYEAGIRVGQWVRYYKSGKILFVGEYERPPRDATWIDYLDRDTLEVGRRTGRWTYFDEEAHVVEAVDYP